MAAGQDERADMLAMRRDMPQGIVEVGPAAPRKLSGGPEDGYLSVTVQDTTTAVPLRPMKAWNVYSDVVKPDRVFFDPDMTAEDVRQALIRHDGYPENIRVRLSVHQPGDRCQCGNPWTVKIDERLYCGQCAPTPMELQEPCLCGEDVKRGCLQACRLGHDLERKFKSFPALACYLHQDVQHTGELAVKLHHGQLCTVVRDRSDDPDVEVEMYRVRFDDGYECDVFPDELTPSEGLGSGTAEEIPDDAYRAAAADLLVSDEHNVDDDAVVSRGSDDGAYVQVWLWVPRDLATTFAYAEAMNSLNLPADQD